MYIPYVKFKCILLLLGQSRKVTFNSICCFRCVIYCIEGIEEMAAVNDILMSLIALVVQSNDKY